MAVCAKCGATLNEGATFCGSCGQPVGAAGAPAGQVAPGAAAGTGMASNVAGLLAYILTPLTAILFLVLEPYTRDKFVRFHAFQALFLGIAAIGLSIVLTIISMILAIIPIVGWILGLILWLVFWLGLFVAWVYLMYKAYNNEKYMLPVIGKLAAQQAG